MPQIVEDSAAVGDSANDRRYVVVQQYEIGCGSRDLGSAFAHRNADVGFAHCKRVVRAVARHCDDVAPRVQSADDAEFLLWTNSREDGDAPDAFC